MNRIQYSVYNFKDQSHSEHYIRSQILDKLCKNLYERLELKTRIEKSKDNFDEEITSAELYVFTKSELQEFIDYIKKSDYPIIL